MGVAVQPTERYYCEDEEHEQQWLALHWAGSTYRYPRSDPGLRRYARQLVDEGHAVKAVADQLGFSEATVRAWLRRED
jgi:hypothetical protein